MNPIAGIARRRLALAGGLALLGWACVVARLVDLSLLSGTAWREEAERQQERSVRLDPERGSFLDREGRELAVSVPAWSCFADPSRFQDARARRAAASKLAKALDADPAALEAKLSQDREFTWISRKLPPELRARVDALAIPG